MIHKINKTEIQAKSTGRNKYTHEEYLSKLKERGVELYPIEDYKGMGIAIEHKCLVCGYVRKVKPTSLTTHKAGNKPGCLYCKGKVVVEGKNDLWTTSPDLAELLKDPQDGYKYMRGSKASVDWVCPNCGEIITKGVYTVARQGLGCPSCKLGGGSYPNKLIYNVLKNANVDFNGKIARIPRLLKSWDELRQIV